MRRAFLLVVLLTMPAEAAPQLKDRKPPDSEEVRIEALKAKYAEVRASGQPVERQRLDLAKVKFQIISILLDDMANRPITSEARQRQERELEREIQSDPILKDLHDIAVYDRKKAAAAK